ncbi:M10 family metallopeptidase [Bradyrhizobium sp. CCBAU 53338]|uniref:M10 family metallopeptidase n=1 Tax=Bradyrhizobium sp. CCBAU 53338 TaxID=1325111 RepID=UPI001FED413E|nr:M10 family metallopeptidase [Bradyrhizobium sp. CCBAU 53338]
MATSVKVSATNNADIDGLLAGVKWSGTISYSFPSSSGTYAYPYSGGDGEPTTSGFSSAPTQMQAAINYAIALIKSYTNASIAHNGTGSSDIMIAQSPAANPTSYAYYPGNYAAGGDVWFGTQYDYTQAQLGNYYFTTALHELGHAFGLKHSQETGGVANVAVPTAHDDSEYTVMSYRSYVGGPLTGYTNEQYGYPETYMANDILALQTLCGANYNTQSGNTVYTWSPTTGQEFINGVGQLADGGGVGGSANRIYETIWDGGGVDTYDLSNYTTNLSINLNPGASSVFSTVQLANLGAGHYASGNVYNAYLYNGDVRSYIDNATGGSANDTVIGNAIANVLKGGAGNDTITGGGGNDIIDGGAATDTAVYSGNRADYTVTYNSATQTFTIADQRAGSPDGTDTITGVENFHFLDGSVAAGSMVPNHAPVLTVPSINVMATAGQAIPASSLFSASDHDGDALTYYILDNTTAPNSGHFEVNGVAQSAGAVHALTSSQLAQTIFVAGAAGVADDLFVIASDGKALSGADYVGFQVNAAPNYAPILTVPSTNVMATAGQTLPASSLFSASDIDGDALTYYILDNTTAPNSGHFEVNGVVESAGTVHTLTRSQLAQTNFVAGAAGVTDDLFVITSDGKALSGADYVGFHVEAAPNHAPVLTVPSTNVMAIPGQTLPVSRLFSASDIDGDALTYYILDNATAPNSGHFEVNGVVESAGAVHAVSSSQLAHTTFVAGAAGVTDDLFVVVSDGKALSNTDYVGFHILV